MPICRIVSSGLVVVIDTNIYCGVTGFLCSHDPLVSGLAGVWCLEGSKDCQ